MSKRKAKLSKNRKGRSILEGLLTLICVALFFSYMFFSVYLETTNYIFDNSYGTKYTYTITDKDIRSGRRGRTKYQFTIMVDEKENILVNSEEYKKYSIGDSVTLVRHVGFLGIEYYEYVDNSE